MIVTTCSPVALRNAASAASKIKEVGFACDSPMEGSGPPTNDQAKKSGSITPRDTVVAQCLQGKRSTVLALSIGIGGHLAMPPLPHHRAYGSVPRRFGGLSARQRIHADQPEAVEAAGGEGAMQRA